MTEPQFISVIGPLLIYIIGFFALGMTIFVYLEVKDRIAKFQSQYKQQCEIDTLKKENQLLQKTIVANIKVA